MEGSSTRLVEKDFYKAVTSLNDHFSYQHLSHQKSESVCPHLIAGTCGAVSWPAPHSLPHLQLHTQLLLLLLLPLLLLLSSPGSPTL